ncbi:sulfatase-like hydrolase/transferase [Campylobacter volucris]|uniref:Sulfatase-like hydrolase/transferase n=2 Tax=Campylobacter volucris TaxID=1031542 RepID=A0A5C7DT45_9BACT|nr:sulfatase-like hydrolase/transferase [Campylobacter volucris]
MSLYGYNLQTTPKLEELEKKGYLIKFSDVIAPFANTQASLRRVLNFSNIENEEEWFNQLNMVDLFNLVGYKSIFISNHEPLSGHTSNITAIANRANKTIFIDKFITDDKIFTKQVDGVILPIVKDNLKNNDFFVVHLMGTHFNIIEDLRKGLQNLKIKILIELLIMKKNKMLLIM